MYQDQRFTYKPITAITTNLISINNLVNLHTSDRLKPNKQSVMLINHSEILILGIVNLEVKRNSVAYTLVFLVTLMELLTYFLDYKV